ncbi:glycosyltransferase family 4 protein [Fredinandcohnia onubensis]|uniref:glycosyltransferase family 4 protein n=1 Tax=Fredinandcohnia onubensis TaxID=1571209 RepID=UPI000C0C04CB|nr:glycosyltransferase family 4 protein [Fredinandcohnia onubensis]
MKILITTIFDYPHEGGLSTHVKTLKLGLEEKGHSVDVLSFSNINPIVKKLVAQGPGFVLNKLQKGKGQLLNDTMRGTLLNTYIKKQKQDYDVINAQDVFSANASIKTGIPTVSTVHGYYANEAISRGAIVENSAEDLKIKEIEKEAYQNSDELIAVDRRINEYVKKLAGVDTHVIKNFINLDSFRNISESPLVIRNEFNIPENKKILLVPRRLTEKNGVIYPTLAMKYVLEKFPNTLLLYAGTGEQSQNIQNEITKNGLMDSVRLLGSVEHEKMKNLYSIADIVLVPSVHSYGVEEATSISALEAMGSGSPVVAGAVGGLKEIFEHEKDGLLINADNVTEFANSIIRLLNDKELCNKLSENAQKKVEEEYSHLAAAAKYESIYQKAIERKKIK